MRLKLLMALSVIGLALRGWAQTSNVTATITDPDGQTWNNGTYTINFVPTPGVPGPYTWNGGQPFTQQFKGSMSGLGVITQSLPSSNFIAPGGSQWRFTMCSNTSAPCQDVVTSVTGAAPNMSAVLSAPLKAPRFQAGQFSFGYLDVEVQGPNGGALIPGIQYWNVTNVITRQWNGTTWQNLSGGGGGGSPANPFFSIQYNNSGVLGAIGPGPLGSQPVFTGTSSAPIAQAKPYIDMRDLYDCSYATDSATALNAAWANGASGVDGSQQTFPIGCHIKLGSTFTVQNHTGFLWRGYSSPGAGGTPGLGAPTFSYCGTAGGTVLNMQFANSPTLENLIVDGQGQGCANGAGTGIVFDKTGPGSTNTTFGVLRNVQITGGITGAHNSAFIGLNMNPVSSQNGEDFLIDHSFVYCQSGANIGTETTMGIKFNQFNNKSEQVFNTNVTGCNTGIQTGPGGVRISGGDFTGNQVDVAWGGNSDPFVLDNFTSEGSPQSLSTPSGGGGSFPNLIANSHFAPGSSASATHCTLSLGDTSNSSYWTLLDDGFDDPSFGYNNVPGSFPLCSNQNNHLLMINTNFVGAKGGESFSSVIESGNSGFILPNGHGFGADYGVIRGGYFRVGGNFTQAGNEDMGYGFLSSQGSDVAGLAYNNSSADGNNAGGLSVGRDAMYLANANVVMKGVWPIPSQDVQCGVNGTAGSTRYPVKVFAKDAAGNRSGWIDYVGNSAACINAQATFSAGNSLTITWQAAAGETNGYDVVLMNPVATTTQGWLAGSVAHGTTTLTVTSGPGAYTYVFPNYYDTAKTIINGESLSIPAPITTPLTVNSTITSNSTITGSTLVSTGANGGISGTEGTGGLVPPGAGLDVMWPDSTAHRWKMNNNNGGAQNVLGSNDWAVPGAIGSTTPNTGAFTTLTGTTITSLAGPVSGTWNCVNVTPITVTANTTNDQNLMACTVAAGALNSVGRTLRIHTKSLYSTPIGSTATLNFKVKLCSVSGCGSGNVATLVNITSTANPGTITNNGVLFDAESTTQTGGAASRHEASGDLIIDLGAVPTSATSTFADTNTTTIAGSPSDIDLTAQNFLQITVAFSVGSASNSVTERQLVVDTVN